MPKLSTTKVVGLYFASNTTLIIVSLITLQPGSGYFIGKQRFMLNRFLTSNIQFKIGQYDHYFSKSWTVCLPLPPGLVVCSTDLIVLV